LTRTCCILPLAAVLLSYFCWLTLLVACVHTAVQHLSFNILMPYLVYPNGTDWIRFMYHAAILIIQFVGTGYIAIRVHRMFADGQRMVARLETTSAEAEAMRGKQDTERARFAAETRVAMSRHADSFERQMTDQAAHLASSASLLQRTAQDMSSAASQASDRAARPGRPTAMSRRSRLPPRSCSLPSRRSLARSDIPP